MTMTQSYHVIFHVDFTLNSIDLIRKKAKTQSNCSEYKRTEINLYFKLIKLINFMITYI